MNFSEVFIRRPIATSLLMAALALVGLAAYPLLPIAPLPQVDFPTIQVTAQLAGANAETMAATVATPLEEQFGQISGVTQLTSVSALGTSVITLQFDLNRNIDGAAQDVQAAITAASKTLPQNLTAPPSYRKVNPADSPVMILAAHSDTLPLTSVSDFAQNVIAQQVSQVSGVALVTIGGQQTPAIRVQVDPAKLEARGLTMEDVRSVLAAATTDAAKGAVNGARQTFTIEANDQLTTPEPYDDVIIAYRNGAPIRIRDVGQSELNVWAPKLLAKLKTLPELADVSTDQQGNAPILTVTINRDAAARFGIQPQQIDATLNDAFGQANVAQYFTNVSSYFVILEILPELQQDPASLNARC